MIVGVAVAVGVAVGVADGVGVRVGGMVAVGAAVSVGATVRVAVKAAPGGAAISAGSTAAVQAARHSRTRRQAQDNPEYFRARVGTVWLGKIRWFAVIASQSYPIVRMQGALIQKRALDLPGGAIRQPLTYEFYNSHS